MTPEISPNVNDLRSPGSMDSLRVKLAEAGAALEEGPVERIGGRNAGRATGTSLYTRDPDRNLLEFIVYP